MKALTDPTKDPPGRYQQSTAGWNLHDETEVFLTLEAFPNGTTSFADLCRAVKHVRDEHVAYALGRLEEHGHIRRSMLRKSAGGDQWEVRFAAY